MASAALGGESIDIGRVVSRGLQTIGRHALPFAALAIVLSAIPIVLMLGVSLEVTPDNPFRIFLSPFYWLSLLFSIVAGYVLQATVVREAMLDLSGRDPEIGPSLIVALRLLLPMIGLATVTGICIAIGWLLLIVPGIIVFIMFLVAVPAMVEERRGVFGSMSRSRELTRGSRWRIFVMLVMYFIVYLLVAGGFAFASGLFAASADGAVPAGGLGIGATVSQILVSAALSLLASAMLASLYVELRTVREGATTDGLAAIFE